MKNFCYYALVAFALIFSSCGSSKINPDDLVSMNAPFDVTTCLKSDGSLIDDWVDSIYVVPLETNDDALVAVINKVVVADDNIYVSDINNSIFIFKSDGLFVKKLSRGQGPGEYAYLLSFFYNHYNRCLYVLDHKKVNRYTSDGVFVESYSIEHNFSYGLPTNDGFLCFEPNYKNEAVFSFYATDSSFNVLDCIDIKKKRYRIYSPNQISYSSPSRDTILFARMFDNCIYQFPCSAPLNVSIRYSYIFDDEFDASIFNDNDDLMYVYSKMQKSDYYYEGEFLESDGYIYSSFCGDIKKTIHLYMNKETKEFRTKWSDNILTKFSGLRGIYNNDFYLSIAPVQIVQCLGPIIDSNRRYMSEASIDVLKRLDTDCNPVIVFFSMKSKGE